MFLILMVIGLVGLVALALPAFGHAHGALSGHGALHGGPAHGALSGHGALHGGPAHGGATHGVGQPAGPLNLGNGGRALPQVVPADTAHESRFRFAPSPRAVFSVLALYGAFGNAALHAFHLPMLLAALGAAVPALLVEWGLVRPLWRVLFRVQGAAASPLEQLLLSEARAVVPFRNGRGIVSAVHDGRRVQLAASLRKDQRYVSVKVGDQLVIEDVDAARETVTVTLPAG